MAITKIQSNAFPASIDLSNIDLTLGANEVLTANIADSNITTAKIADGAVHTDKIADNNVTHAKLHTDMDLSGKTVTLPALSQTVTAAAFVGDGSGLTGLPTTLTDLGIANHDDITVDGSGNVGIGTSSPDSLLHIVGDGTSAGSEIRHSYSSSDYSAGRYFNLGNYGTNTQLLARQSSLTLGTRHGQHVEFKANNSEAMRITSGGNVGIGTANPQQKLHVAGGRLIIDAPDNGYSGLKIHDDNSSDYNVYLDMGRDQGDTNFWIRSGGRQQGVTPWTDATPSPVLRASKNSVTHYARKTNFNTGGPKWQEQSFTLQLYTTSNNYYQPVHFRPEGGSITNGNGNWRGEMWIGIYGSTRASDHGGTDTNWAGGSMRFVWDCGHWNAKPNIYELYHYDNVTDRFVGQRNLMSTTSAFILWLWPVTYHIRIISNPGTDYYWAGADQSFSYYNSGSTYTASPFGHGSRDTWGDSFRRFQGF